MAPNPQRPRERAGPGPARKFPLRVSGRFSLLKAHRLEPVFSSWPGRDFISARLADCKPGTQYPVQGNECHVAQFGRALGGVAVSRCHSGPQQGAAAASDGGAVTSRLGQREAFCFCKGTPPAASSGAAPPPVLPPRSTRPAPPQRSPAQPS